MNLDPAVGRILPSMKTPVFRRTSVIYIYIYTNMVRFLFSRKILLTFLVIVERNLKIFVKLVFFFDFGSMQNEV